MLQFFSVDTIAFDVFGYPLSYVELIGTIFNLWSVWLVTRRRIETWPVGLVGITLFLLVGLLERLALPHRHHATHPTGSHPE